MMSASVVPGVILLLVLPFLCNGENIKFGTRVEQATNLCRSHEACRFGYTFTDSESDLLTSESRTSEETQEVVKMTRRRRPRINIDPRRRPQGAKVRANQRPLSRSHDHSEVTQRPTSAPVTIRIGGESIVIPDFDLGPRIEATTRATRQPPIKKTGKKSRGHNKRNRNNRRKNKQNNSGQSQLRNSSKTKVLKLFGANSIKQSSSQTRHKSDTTSTATSRPTTLPATSPISSTSSTLINTILDSFSTLQRTVTEATVFPSFTTVRPRSTRGRGTTSERPGATLTVERTTQKQRPRERLGTTLTVERTTQRPRLETTLTAERTTQRPWKRPEEQPLIHERICPESLGKCVDACVPLQDIYAYSACVVECGERCPVVLVQ